MTKPIRATRDNLLPGTIWQNAAGTDIARVKHIGMTHMQVHFLHEEFRISDLTKSEFIKSDLWYKIQPVKEPTE